VPYFSASLFILSCFYSPRAALKVMLLLIISYDEFSRSYLNSGSDSTLYSIFTLDGIIGSVFFSIISIFFIFIIVVNFSRISEFKIEADSLIVKLMLFALIGSCVGVFNLVDNPRMYLSDLSYFLTIIFGFYIIKITCLNNKANLVDITEFIVVLLVIKMSVVLFDYFFWAGELITLKTGSDAYVICVLPLLYYALNSIKGRTSPLNIIFVFLVILVTFYLIVTASRGKVIVFFLSIISIFYMEKNFKLLWYSMISVIFVWVSLSFINSNYINYFLWKISSFGANADTGESSLVRLYSLYNILYEQYESVYPFFIGKGFGSYFSSYNFPFPIALDDQAFNSEWIASDKFYKPHTTIMFLLLKIGLLPMILIYINALYSAIKFRAQGSLFLSGSYRSFYFLSPILMLVNFTSKLQFLTGVIIGLGYCCINSRRNK
jgi:hypothetical protein